MVWLFDTDNWISFVTLTALEIVLGVDNLVFIALLSGRLPERQRARARVFGVGIALVARLALLGSIFWIMRLVAPLATVAGHVFSWRDLILIAGGGFLLFKGTGEIHRGASGEDETPDIAARQAGLLATISQIVLFDLIFSLDSVITAVGMAQQIWVMVAAIVAAMALMLVASGPLSNFIERNASVKMLAFAFLLLVGMVLLADGFGFHVPRGYIYAAMGFSVGVESLNLWAARAKRKRKKTPTP
jgi:predicted tellurium resistance membrane protein TerC